MEYRRTDIGSPESNGFCERAHQGSRTQGRTPYQAFSDGIAAMRDLVPSEAETEVKPEAA